MAANALRSLTDRSASGRCGRYTDGRNNLFERLLRVACRCSLADAKRPQFSLLLSFSVGLSNGSLWRLPTFVQVSLAFAKTNFDPIWHFVSGEVTTSAT